MSTQAMLIKIILIQYQTHWENQNYKSSQLTNRD